MRVRLVWLGAILFTGIARPQDAADKAAFEAVCGKCHATSMIDSFRSEPDWRDTVAQMVELGAQGTEEQLAGIRRYLRRVWTRINVNTATAEEIAATLGVGDAVAKSIVTYRAGHGKFGNCDDLIKVPGAAGISESCRNRIVF